MTQILNTLARRALSLIVLSLGISIAAQADSERWYLMTAADDLKKPMGFYHDKSVTDAENGITASEVALRARVDLFFFKIKVDQFARMERDEQGILNITGDFNRGGKTFLINGRRNADTLAIDVKKKDEDYTYKHQLSAINTTDLDLMSPVDLDTLKTAGKVSRSALLPEEENLVNFETRYIGKKAVKMPDGRRQLHVLERDDSREQQELWVDDNGVIQVLIGKRRAIVMSDRETVEAWAAKNP